MLIPVFQIHALLLQLAKQGKLAPQIELAKESMKVSRLSRGFLLPPYSHC